MTGEVSDTPVIRATLQGLYTATFSLTKTTRRMNRSGAYTDRQKRYNIVACGDLALTIRHDNSERKRDQHRRQVPPEAVEGQKLG